MRRCKAPCGLPGDDVVRVLDDAGCATEDGAGQERQERHKRHEREEVRNLLHRLAIKMDELAWRVQRMDVAEFAEYYRRPWRVFWVSFLTGIARGLGIAVGLTVLTALLVFLLRQVVMLNLPGIGHFLAQIIRIINRDLALYP